MKLEEIYCNKKWLFTLHQEEEKIPNQKSTHAKFSPTMKPQKKNIYKIFNIKVT
jgi:hypothetical protein